jgi:hypothetical protein
MQGLIFDTKLSGFKQEYPTVNTERITTDRIPYVVLIYAFVFSLLFTQMYNYINSFCYFFSSLFLHTQLPFYIKAERNQ